MRAADPARGRDRRAGGVQRRPRRGRDHARGLHADVPRRRSTGSRTGCATPASRSRLDAVGNLFGRWAGGEPDAALVLTGSHVDTTLNAGRYDGVLGVLGAIEAVRLLRERGLGAAALDRGRRLGGGGAALRHRLRRQPRRRRHGSSAPTSTALRDRDGTSAWRRRCATRASIPTGWPTPRSTRRPCTRSSSCTSSRASVLERGGEPIGVVDGDRRAARLPAHAARRGHARRGHADGPAPRRARRRGRGDERARAARARLGERHDRRHGRRACACDPARSTSCPATVELDVDVRDSDLRRARAGRRRRVLAAARAIAGAPRAGARGDADRRGRAGRLRRGAWSPPPRRRRRARAAVPPHDQRRLPRRDDHGRARPDRDDLRAERRRHQPPPRRVHRPGDLDARRARCSPGTLERLAA